MPAPDPAIGLFDVVGQRLEEAITYFKAGNHAVAVAELELAVELCENHPTYALTESVDLGSSLHGVVTRLRQQCDSQVGSVPAWARRRGPQCARKCVRASAYSTFEMMLEG